MPSGHRSTEGGFSSNGSKVLIIIHRLTNSGMMLNMMVKWTPHLHLTMIMIVTMSMTVMMTMMRSFRAEVAPVLLIILMTITKMTIMMTVMTVITMIMMLSLRAEMAEEEVVRLQGALEVLICHP